MDCLRDAGLGLGAGELMPFWQTCADLGLYVFIHRCRARDFVGIRCMRKDDLGRMLGWEFSLMTATVRVVFGAAGQAARNLNIQFAHFAGGIGRYTARARAFQRSATNGARPKWRGTTAGRPKPFDHYLEQRLYYDCAGWAGPDHAGPWGAEWVRFGMHEVALPQIVFATDYPQAVRVDSEVVDYVNAVRALGPNERLMLEGLNVEKLIPDARARLAKRKK